MKFTTIVVIYFILILINMPMIKGQEKNIIVLPELSINNEQFTFILDSLINKERKCSYFDKSLLWVISISKKSDSTHLIEIEIVRNFNALRDNPKLYGFFYLNQILFVVENEHIDNLFTITTNKKKFSKKWVMPTTRRYPMWHYYYENGEFILKNDYSSIDCN